MARFQQNAVRHNYDTMCVSIILEVDHIQQLKAWINALQLPPDAQRLVTAATTLLEIGTASFACACERMFDGIVNLYIETV